MRILIGATLALLLASSGAEAALFGLFGGHKGRQCLPRAIDSPVLRPKLKERHKEGKRSGVHPKRCLQMVAPGGTATA
jgi:hypothetical protein